MICVSIKDREDLLLAKFVWHITGGHNLIMMDLNDLINRGHYLC